MATNQPRRYNLTSQCFHWLVAALVLVMIMLGFSLEWLPEDWHRMVMKTHKATGVLILGLTLLRLSWQTFTRSPLPLPAPRYQLKLAHVTHIMLYFLMLAMSLTGLMMMSAVGNSISFFGFMEIPPLLPENDLMDVLATIHGWLAYALIGFIGFHTAGALYHHLVLKDETLQRMIK
jgi:cytochrome b561